ncbi:hypothetical protein AUP74_03078 [Microbulbifer aggregans]|uniref:Uncharacterized protein n=1 Tax=Microbulbifer aggregans TaxID=1769779 RepID=A0A1C9WBB3_9GAMM|nr:hypothetical protein [Microbulbifer aggregans]AOS98444.1 hypothetical protein AUP74_03078 [Microbulbifer aggregans]
MKRNSTVVRAIGMAATAVMMTLLATYMFILVKIQEELSTGLFIALEGLGVISLLILIKPFLEKRETR